MESLPISSKDQIVADNAREFVEGLINARNQEPKITSIVVKSCGVAFLHKSEEIVPDLDQIIQDVMSIKICTDLVTMHAFELLNTKLVPVSAGQRQVALNTSLRDGLLGRFLMKMRQLHTLVLNMQCHELTNPAIVEGGLVLLLGNCIWTPLQHLELQGVCTTQFQLEDLIGRHHRYLKYLRLSDIVMTEGNWHSFFDNLGLLLIGSQISRQSLHLSGNFFQGNSCLNLDADATCAGDQSIGEYMLNKVFPDDSIGIVFGLEEVHLDI